MKLANVMEYEGDWPDFRQDFRSKVVANVVEMRGKCCKDIILKAGKSSNVTSEAEAMTLSLCGHQAMSRTGPL